MSDGKDDGPRLWGHVRAPGAVGVGQDPPTQEQVEHVIEQRRDEGARATASVDRVSQLLQHHDSVCPVFCGGGCLCAHPRREQLARTSGCARCSAPVHAPHEDGCPLAPRHVMVRDGQGKVDDPATVQPWRRVFVETPYAGERGRNLRYLRACLRDCLRKGEAPYASHGLYTQNGVLDDGVPEERAMGLRAGRLYRSIVDATVVYTDLGISGGMVAGIEDAAVCLRKIEYRKLPGWGNGALGLSSAEDERHVQAVLWPTRDSQAALRAALELVERGHDVESVRHELHRHLYGNQAPREVTP